MTQEDKKLLLNDLCSRLVYGVVLNVGDKDIKLDRQHQNIGVMYPEDCSKEFNERNGCQDFYIVISGCYYGEDIKPYLRLISNMTEEEEKELSRKYNWDIRENQISIRYHSEGYWDDETECPTEEYLNLFDWLNTHHFDYRGLIKKDLALEAPEFMYK